MIELQQAFVSLSAASNIVKSMLELRDFTQLNNKVIELQQAIISAQEKVLSSQREQDLLLTKIQELEKECKRLNDWSAEKERYELKEIASGVFAYIEKNHEGSLQSAHKLCATCFEQRTKSILQHESLPIQLGHDLLTCQHCKSMLTVQKYLDKL